MFRYHRKLCWTLSLIVCLSGFALAPSSSAGRIEGLRISGIVGSYRVVTHVTKGQLGTGYDTLQIATYKSSTGAITGRGEDIVTSTRFRLTGSVKGSKVVLNLAGANHYTIHLRGTIAKNGMARGALTDNTGSVGTWRMTRVGQSTTKAHPPATARVVAVASGFDRDPSGGPGDLIDYGVILKNRALRFAAVNVAVTVRAVDTSGRSVATDEIPVSVIPAGHTFVVSGSFVPSVSLGFTRLRVAIKVGQWRSGLILLPVAQDVQLGTGIDCCDVSGGFTNPYTRAISQDAPIYAVYLDGRGRIVGGTSDYTGAAVQPGATVSFDLSGFLNNPNAHPVRARVSIDPCGEFGTSGTCPALEP